jgi:hypothetical protein
MAESFVTKIKYFDGRTILCTQELFQVKYMIRSTNIVSIYYSQSSEFFFIEMQIFQSKILWMRMIFKYFNSYLIHAIYEMFPPLVSFSTFGISGATTVLP